VTDRYSYQRRQMIELLEKKGVRDSRVLEAMQAIPRHKFVPGHLRTRAYGDHALPIGQSQTISQPYIVARMTELLDVKPDHSVLEIGTGSGYQTAILARLARRVYSLERVAELAHRAIQRMRELGLDNVKIQTFDGTVGWSDVAPFDRIMVTAGSPSVPPPLMEQLRVGGRLLIPEGDRTEQILAVYRKLRQGGTRKTQYEPVTFVPLIGRHGWQGSEA
jgi:protein-L-isoaspartate(D-aspartate) O-methyltransferase